jgi:hypothetical protein
MRRLQRIKRYFDALIINPIKYVTKIVNYKNHVHTETRIIIKSHKQANKELQSARTMIIISMTVANTGLTMNALVTLTP